MRRVRILLSAVALVSALIPIPVLGSTPDTTWIVTLRAGSDAATLASPLARQHGGDVRYVYRHAFNGFAFRGSEAAARALRANPQVAAVEADAPVSIVGEQTNATWGLDRIDQRNLPLNGMYVYDTTGAGVTAYIIDTGIRTTHSEFAARASVGFDAFGGSGQDCHGHGTHVAGTVGGTTYGVAKSVTLIAVRVLDCNGNGTTSSVVAGVDWVTGHHTGNDPAVANMSLGGGADSAIDTAVRNSIADNVSYAIAAGNGDFLGRARDACNYSPARVSEAMTISATNSSDAKASWANYGSCVDWFAPGVSITSAWSSSNTATNTISGTSMATPHTAGVAALYLETSPTASPAAVRDVLYNATTKNAVTSANTTNNDLLSNLNTGGGGSTDTPPTASITSPTSGSTLSGTVTVSASAGDDHGVSKVDFFADGASIGTDTDGTNGWSVAWDTTTASNGDHSLTARATDTANQTTTSSPVSVSVSNTGSPSSMSTVLSSSTSGSGPNWTANVAVSVRDSANNPVSGATVSWTWSNGATGSGSCTTGSSGQCTDVRTQHKRVGSVTFTIDAVTHTSLTWTGSAKSITVSKP